MSACKRKDLGSIPLRLSFLPPPPPHTHTPFSPFLISLMVSVDVKHHVYLLTYLRVGLLVQIMTIVMYKTTDPPTAQYFDCDIVICLIVEEEKSVLCNYSLTVNFESWNVFEIIMRILVYAPWFVSVCKQNFVVNIFISVCCYLFNCLFACFRVVLKYTLFLVCFRFFAAGSRRVHVSLMDKYHHQRITMRMYDVLVLLYLLLVF